MKSAFFLLCVFASPLVQGKVGCREKAKMFLAFHLFRLPFAIFIFFSICGVDGPEKNELSGIELIRFIIIHCGHNLPSHWLRANS